MNLAPTDFRLGIRDLLTVLVPGVVLAFALTPAYSWLFGGQRLFPHLAGDAGVVTAFIVTAYILGHLIEAVASVLLDPVYDRTYRNLKRLPTPAGPEGSAQGFTRRLLQAWRLKDAVSHDPLRDAARTVHLARVKERGLGRDLAGAKAPSLLDWSQSAVVLHAAPGATDIESLQAASKFFRSMAIVVILVPVIALIRAAVAWPMVSRETIVELCAALLAGIFLAVAVSLRFMKLRWTATQRTYEYYIESQRPRTRRATPSLE